MFSRFYCVDFFVFSLFSGSIVLTSLFSVCFTSPGEFESTGSYAEDEKYFTGGSDSI